MVEVSGLKKIFDGRSVLDSMSFTIEEHDTLCVVGPTGCGKSTLLRCIAGLEKPDAGNITCDGDIAVMFQEPRLLPWKDAEDNIRAVLKKESFPLAQKYLSLVGLEDSAKKYPHELSGGMAQRVSFARFLSYAEESGATTLLLDEPFSALDSETEEKMLSVLLDFAADKTVILVTHDHTTAENLGGEIVKL